MSVPATESMALTREHIRHIRNASRLCFDWANGPFGETAGIRAILEIPGGRNDVTFDIPCASVLTDYAAQYTSDASDRVSAFEMVHSVRFSDTVRTFVEFLKVGDLLTLEWWADVYGKDSSVRKAGLHTDELSVSVQRGRKRYAFNIASRTGPEDSARMIRSRTGIYSLA